MAKLKAAAQNADDSNIGNLETTFAKLGTQQLGTYETETKILGMGWNNAKEVGAMPKKLNLEMILLQWQQLLGQGFGFLKVLQ